MKKKIVVKKPIAKTRLAVVPKPFTAKQFARLSDARKRVMIAEDALATLATREAPQLGKGDYFSIRMTAPEVDKLHEALPAVQANCHVCAKGMLFLSHVRLFDEVDMITQAYSGENVCVPLVNYFPQHTLDLIEIIFEGWNRATEYISDYGDDLDTQLTVRKACVWIHTIPTAVDRFKEICRNIIRHKGDFDVTDFSFVSYVPTTVNSPA